VAIGALGAAVWLVRGAGGPESEPVTGVENGEAAAPERPTVELAFGEAFDAPPLAISVVSAGPANLPAEASPPEEGTKNVVVTASVTNTSDTALPINGTPYSVYNTVLETGGREFDGALVAGALRSVQDGTIPAGAELTLRYLFAVPEESRDATFTWPPSRGGDDQPTIVVPIADVSVRTP